MVSSKANYQFSLILKGSHILKKKKRQPRRCSSACIASLDSQAVVDNKKTKDSQASSHNRRLNRKHVSFTILFYNNIIQNV